MIGNSVAHYKILEKIGEGGMGVVYKAEDTKLKRTVALKLLPPELTKDAQARARFIQEAQAAAALDHPNICAVHEIGEAEGATYIVMPYIKGQSLKEKIAAGPIGVEEALSIAGQVAEGLKEAHDRGITHRDIKPANIMLTEKAQAKIMDFGLAKLEAGADLTRTMAVVGTAAYMSPEQARGEAVDLRTDIWSFGATLYEMLTGQKPFGQKHDQALFYSILNHTTETISRIRPEIPGYLDRIIQKALEKDRSRRYQNIAELIKDLEAARTSGPGLPKAEKSIIVLPFENISSDAEQEYFCDGMTEEIITDLSHVHDLLVISRSSAMTFKGTKKTIPEIAHAVNVRYVLEGSVRKAGNSLRIAAQLIDASTDTHLWAEKYSGTINDIFGIQESVSHSIVDALKIKLSPEENREINERPFENIQAYECYTRAWHEMIRFTEHSLDHALKILQNGMDIMGENADLLAGMALAYIYCQEAGFKRDEDPLQKAEEFIQKVKKVKPDSPHYYHLQAKFERYRGSAINSIGLLKRALVGNPNNVDALFFLGYLLAVFAGRPDEAEPYVKRLLDIDPLTPFNYFVPMMLSNMRGEMDSAVASARRMLKMGLENRLGKYMLSRMLSLAGQLDEAFEVVDDIAMEDSTDLTASLSLFSKYALQGERDKALLILTEDAKKYSWEDPEWPLYMVGYYSLINEKEEAFRWLEHTINRGLINYPLLSETDPFLANIRGEPRFQKLMERVKYEWEHFKE